jgi:ATP-binding cassette subfamily C protein CydCD
MASRTEQRLRSVVLRDIAAALDARDELCANALAAPVLADIRKADAAATVAAQRSAWAEGLGQAIVVLAGSAAALWSGLLALPAVVEGSTTPAAVAVVVLLQLALIESYAAAVPAARLLPALGEVMGRIAGSGVWDSPDAGAAGTAGLQRVPARARPPRRRTPVPVGGVAGGSHGLRGCVGDGGARTLAGCHWAFRFREVNTDGSPAGLPSC